jgi:hypothetical protein
MTLRLRQLCLVAAELEPVVDAVHTIFGLQVCHRDPGVAKYGLANALFVCGHQFLEIVAPTRDGTAAGRFLQRTGGRGGYIAIFDTHDPERRRAHVQTLGLRIANMMAYPDFYGIQLHPADCRATMLEFDRSAGNDSLDGAYWPAGPHWRDEQRLDRVSGLPCIEVQSPDPSDLATHWSRIIETPVARNAQGEPVMRFELGGVRFVRAPAGEPERFSALHIDVADAPRVLQAAHAWGCALDGTSTDRGFMLAGVRWVPHSPAATRA